MSTESDGPPVRTGQPIGALSLSALSRALRPGLYAEEEKSDEYDARLVRIERVEKYAAIVAAYRPHAVRLRARRVWDREDRVWVRQPDTAPALADLLRDPQARDRWLARQSGRAHRKAA